jgi:ribosome biogenesis GTPase
VSPARGTSGLDEEDVHIRPGRGSRPRTKRRPTHEGATTGLVVAVDRGRYTCVLSDDPRAHRAPTAAAERSVTAMKSRSLGRASVVVGDRVDLVGDLSGQPGSLARIVRVRPRHGALRRTADDTDPVERVIVAGVDQMVIVTSAAEPPPRPRLVDRCLVAAYDADVDPLLVVTKTDRGDPAGLLAGYAPLHLPIVLTGRADEAGDHGLVGLDELSRRLGGRMSVLVGQSGVGKSTLVNALVPGARRAVGAVSEVTGRGRHTSTSAVALRLPAGGWVIDTPGLRSFGLAHVHPARVLNAFSDLAGAARDCPRGCSHDEPECALDAWVAAGHADPARLDSLRRLLRARPTQAGD